VKARAHIYIQGPRGGSPDADARRAHVQVSTTKGTGGDLLILEEAAYVDPGFFYETVAPLLCMQQTTMIAISTLTSSVNFYSRLIKMRNKTTGAPLFNIYQARRPPSAPCVRTGSASAG
jgi:hypothetical protein